MIESSSQSIRPEVEAFALEMESVLRKHDALKGDSWKQMSYDELRDLLFNEFIEAYKVTSKPHPREFVDLANIAMMFWWRDKEAGAASEV